MPPLFGSVPAPVAVHFLLRVTMEPGSEWDFGDRLGQVGLVVERGTLTLVDPRGGQDRRRTGDSLALNQNAPHLVQNRDAAPLAFLVFGIVPARFTGTSILEVHRATCPPGARLPYFRDCHHLGEPFVPFELDGPGGSSARERTELTISEMVPEIGPGVALFRGLGAGRYHLAEPRWQESDPPVYVYCADRTEGPFVDGPTLAEFRGTASAGLVLDVPEGAYVVCDWYAGV
jgi:hypothetical protein